MYILFQNGNFLLATYRCQANTTRLELKVVRKLIILSFHVSVLEHWPQLHLVSEITLGFWSYCRIHVFTLRLPATARLSVILTNL